MTAPTVTLEDVAQGLDGSRLMTLDQCEAGAALVRAAAEVVSEAWLHSCWAHRTIAGTTCDMCLALAAFDKISRGEA